MSEIDADILTVRSLGWTQGSVLTASATDLGLDGVETSQYIVASHPCDVVSLSFERDPHVELIPIDILEKTDGNLTFRKNPRKLHIEIKSGVVSIEAGNKFLIGRRILASLKPDFSLSESDRRIFAAWLSFRYQRAVFADEFNERLRPAQKSIETAIKKRGSKLSGIYLATQIDELPRDTAYSVSIVGTMLDEDWPSKTSWADCSELVEELKEAFDGVPGITVVSAELVAENDVSLSLLRTHARWDAESVSYREGDDAAYPPD
ncbi:hypothetical protein ACFXQA_06460 [Microbacterium sp. P07]|uniref:hypothetical protein n=1 Tax=Microbacterium sp. P07 TaxID=3366952 RepID=UPI003744D4F5